MNFDAEGPQISRLMRRAICQGLMKMVQMNGRNVDSKWALMNVRYMDMRGLRLHTHLRLPWGYEVLWEFRIGVETESTGLRGILVGKSELPLEDGVQLYEYEVRFVMDERHPLLVHRNTSYSELSRAKVVYEGVKLDLHG
ncbi:hypothetical protein [Paenibacillus sp. FSL H8-0034]|uniref:hypothetical protein n=1 Tax=Paenibacillus sp. FSL H8-0034 TaxID=2954671 RepID=UPI0030F6050D